MILLGWLLACSGDSAPEAPPASAPDAPAASAPAPEDAPPVGADGLVEAEGVQLVRAHCAACHSLQLVRQNRMTRERWDATITWMQETQKLWPIPPEQREPLLDYLGTWQAPAPVEGDSPWATPTYRPNPLW